MSKHGKVIVAMSGGVDSSVAACLLKEQGYECIGVFMRVGAPAADHQSRDRKGAGEQVCAAPAPLPYGRGADGSGSESRTVSNPRRLKHGCCSVDDALDARAIANRLGIPFYALNFQPDFDRIIHYFVDEYTRARTPNPCVMCNIELKFGKLLRYADAMDAEYVATGHYARIVQQDGAPRMARAAHREKDQSYVLFGIRRGDLGRCLFPIGDLPDKAAVRRIAADLGLQVHDKPDSQEICFVPNNDYRELVRQRRPESQRPGEVRDGDGRRLGNHGGIVNYTVGQRRGLGIAAGQPIYVTRLEVLNNVVTVGPREDLLARGLIAERMNWLIDPPAEGAAIPAAMKIRHTHTPAAGSLRCEPGGLVRARFDEPQTAVTPGQAAVFYADDVVLGGGWIRSAIAQDGDEAIHSASDASR